MAAEQLLSTVKGVTPVTGTPPKPLPREAFIDPRTGAERPLNNPVTNPNYQADLTAGQKNAELNKQFVAVAESKTLSPEQKQVQMDSLRAQKTAMEGITPEMRTQYTAEVNLPQNLYAPPRDTAKEDATISRLGGAPTSDAEYSKMLVATYGKGGLEQRGATIDKNGLVSVVDPALLKASGFSDSQIQSLVKASGQGGTYNPELLKAQGLSDEQIKALAPLGTQANQTAAPSNSTLGVLQEALRAAKGVGQPGFGVSDLMSQVGIATTGAIGYNNLTNALEQRREEMQQNYSSYADLVKSVGGNMLDNYTAVMKQYNDALTGIKDINEEARQFEKQLELEKKRSEIDMEKFKLQEDYRLKKEKETPVFVPGTENQPAGFVVNGKFEPLSVGGNAYGATATSYGYGGTPAPNGSSQYYSTPAPHGSVNATVVASNPKLIDVYKNGFQKALGNNALSGQCAFEAQQWVDFNGKGWKVGNSLQEKAKSLDNFVKQGQGFYKGQAFGQVGNAIISNDDPKYGHVSVINAITEDGKYVVSEFNRAGSRVFTNNRILDPNDKSILGVLKTVPKSQYQITQEKDIASAATKAVGAIKDIFTGKKQGGLLDLLGAATTLGTKALVAGGKTIVDAKAKADLEIKKQEGIKAGILDEKGLLVGEERANIRSGGLPESVVNSRYTDLKKAVQKGLAPEADLRLFEQDMIFGEVQRKKLGDTASTAEIRQTRKEFYGLPIVKKFSDLSNSYSGLKTAYDSYKTGAIEKGTVDQALVTLFNKMLDPGSVVREGEYARTAEGQAAITRAQEFVTQLSKGGAGINDKTRQDMVNLANNLQAAAQKQFNNEAQFYAELAPELGTKPENLLGAYNKYYTPEGSQKTSTPTSGTIIARGPDGNIYPIDAARWAKTSEEEKRQWTILN